MNKQLIHTLIRSYQDEEHDVRNELLTALKGSSSQGYKLDKGLDGIPDPVDQDNPGGLPTIVIFDKHGIPENGILLGITDEEKVLVRTSKGGGIFLEPEEVSTKDLINLFNVLEENSCQNK